MFFLRLRILTYPFFLLSLAGIGLFVSCQNAVSSERAKENDLRSGKSLANSYCQSCHLLPDPSLADKNTWVDGILPNMGPRLGIFTFNGRSYPSNRSDKNLGKNYYPDHPLLTSEQWNQILTYYHETAPDSLPAQNKKQAILPVTPAFKAIRPKKQYSSPVSTFIQIDTSSTPARLVQADGQLKFIYTYDNKLNLIDSQKTDGTLVDILLQKDKMILCNIGLINPNDGKYGNIQVISRSEKKHSGPSEINIKSTHVRDSLRRPVQIVETDLNGDGKKDYLICEFGNFLGALSWLENNGDGSFTYRILRATPGAIRAIIQDYNHDGLPDIWVLFAQGDEGIVLFTNKGNGKFEQEQILRFPAIYGSSHFELVDFNGDGYPDILYTCGDNADYSRILKPYHGVYVFLNDGQQHFTQRFFYPIHGCYKAIAKDFDGDGDMDIAAISFFADYSLDPEEGFVYLENKGNWNFEASTIPETKTGRWLTMDAGDLDGDGKPDIILGNFSVGPTIIKTYFDWKSGPPFLFLKNVSKK